MPYEGRWHTEGRILLGRVYGDLPLPEVEAASRDLIGYLEQGQRPVHLITDMTDLSLYPFNIRAIRSAADFLNHPALGWWQLFGSDNPSLRLLTALVARIAGVKFRWAQSQDEALAFLIGQDDSLRDLSPAD
jgi:hypothetical protein